LEELEVGQNRRTPYPPTPIHFQQTPVLTPQSSFLHPDAGQHELARARESIAKLEEKQNRSFVEEVNSAKAMTKLECELKAIALIHQSEIQAKDCAVIRLEAELKAAHVAAAATARHLMYACIIAMVAVTVWRR
jgi:hypothetical protein